MKKLLLVALLALPMSVFAQKFAHVNSGTIIQAMPEYTTAQTELETLSKTLSDELTRMQDEFKTKYEDYQKNAETLPDAAKQRREQELQDLDKHINEYYQTSSQDLEKARQEKMQAIADKVGKAIQEVGSAGGYVYVMDLTAGIPYINETLSKDVTQEVMTKLGIK
ncbi:MAG: OmpH family outer membrane protein [Bacteroidaceae bacterium]|nr:OmpH family outer membrane protein [Bacteroidaceae bacterium]